MPARQFGWFDSPDGEDIVKKADLGLRAGVVCGIPFAIFDHFMYPQAGLKSKAFRAAACIIPFAGAGAAFALTTQALSKKYPKTQPEWFYAAGGAVAGSVIGGAVRSAAAGSVAAFYFAVIAAISRDMISQGAYPSTFTLKQRLDNDDLFLAADYRINPQPMNKMPLPAARPARPHSDLGY